MEDDTVPVHTRIESSLCSDSDVEFVLLFGSQLDETARPSSDLDIAVKFSDELTDDERFRRRCELSGRLQSRDVPYLDISDLEDLPIPVAHDAVRGHLLCGDEAAFQAYKADIERQYEASMDDRKRERRAFIRRVAEEGLRG